MKMDKKGSARTEKGLWLFCFFFFFLFFSRPSNAATAPEGRAGKKRPRPWHDCLFAALPSGLDQTKQSGHPAPSHASVSFSHTVGRVCASFFPLRLSVSSSLSRRLPLPSRGAESVPPSSFLVDPHQSSLIPSCPLSWSPQLARCDSHSQRLSPPFFFFFFLLLFPLD